MFEKHVTIFDDSLDYKCGYTKIFGTLITEAIGRRFSNHTYLVLLLYLGKLSRTSKN